MINVTLKQFRYFDALAQTGHFGRAAELSAVSQPALSMQIKDLEEALGAQLFERTARQVRLTPLGEELRLRVQEILRAVDEIGDLARVAGETLVGRMRLGVIPTVAPYLLPRVMQRIGAEHPGLDLYIRETVTPKLISELRDGRLDAAILAVPVSEPGLTETALFKEDFVLVRPGADRDVPLPSKEGLRAMRLLLLEEGHCFRDQALSFCEMGGNRPREMLDGSSLSTLVQMVNAGIGVTLLPEMALDVETRSADVSVHRFATPRPTRTIGMIWRSSTPLAIQLTQLAEIVRDAADRAA